MIFYSFGFATSSVNSVNLWLLILLLGSHVHRNPFWLCSPTQWHGLWELLGHALSYAETPPRQLGSSSEIGSKMKRMSTVCQTCWNHQPDKIGWVFDSFEFSPRLRSPLRRWSSLSCMVRPSNPTRQGSRAAMAEIRILQRHYFRVPWDFSGEDSTAFPTSTPRPRTAEPAPRSTATLRCLPRRHVRGWRLERRWPRVQRRCSRWNRSNRSPYASCRKLGSYLEDPGNRKWLIHG